MAHQFRLPDCKSKNECEGTLMYFENKLGEYTDDDPIDAQLRGLPESDIDKVVHG